MKNFRLWTERWGVAVDHVPPWLVLAIAVLTAAVVATLILAGGWGVAPSALGAAQSAV